MDNKEGDAKRRRNSKWRQVLMMETKDTFVFSCFCRKKQKDSESSEERCKNTSDAADDRKSNEVSASL